MKAEVQADKTCKNNKFLEIIKRNFSKIKVYDSTLLKNYAGIIAFISSIVTILSFLGTAIDSKIGTCGCIIIFVFLLIIIFVICFVCANLTKCAKLSINNTKIEIVIGDIFEHFDHLEKRKHKLNVIPVNNFYDVIVDNRIVSETTLHGKYIKKLKELNKLDDLNKVIENDSILIKTGNPVNVCERLEGRKTTYDLGSVVEFENYVLTAFTNFDEDNKAYVSADDYLHFWMKFWENIDLIFAGRTIIIPLIGAGITRFRNGKPSKQQLLETMLWSLKISGFHNTYGNKKIVFLIHKDDADEINFFHLQHNLNFR